MAAVVIVFFLSYILCYFLFLKIGISYMEKNTDWPNSLVGETISSRKNGKVRLIYL